MQAGVGRPLAALVLRSERRERSSGSELQDRRTEVAERVCEHTCTHYRLCARPLANPPLDERAIAPRLCRESMCHVARQRGRSTSTHLAPGMIGPEWVRRPQSAADHVTGISAAGPDDRPSAKRPRSSSARSLATARTQTEGACGALRLGVPAASLFFPSSEAIAAGYTDGERTFAGGPPGPNGKSVVSTPLPSKDLSTGEAGATGTVDWV